MAVHGEEEIANLEKEVGELREALVQVTAEKLALENLHGELPPPVAPPREKDLATLRRQVMDAEARQRELELSHGEELQELKKKHEQELEHAREEARAQAAALRVSISTLSQEADLLRARSEQAEEDLAAATAKLRGREQELATALEKAHSLDEKACGLTREKQELREQVTHLEHAVERLTKDHRHAQEQVEKIKRARTPLWLARFGRAGEPTAEALKALPEWRALEGEVAQAHLETRIAEQLAAELQKDLEAAQGLVRELREKRLAALQFSTGALVEAAEVAVAENA